MNEQELLQFYTSGGDLSTLDDASLSQLAALMKVQMNTAPSPPPGLLNQPAGQTVPPSNTPPWGPENGQDFVEGLGSVLLQAGALGAGMPGIGLKSGPVSTLLQMILGGAEGAINPPEGEDRLSSALSGAAFGGGVEGGGRLTAAKAPSVGNRVAMWTGTPGSFNKGGRGNRYLEAFLNQRRREGFGQGVPVGKTQAAVVPKLKEGTLTPKPIRQRLNSELDDVKAALPGRDIDFMKIREDFPSEVYQPEKFLGLSDPRGTAEAILADESKFWYGNEALLDSTNPRKGTRVRTRTQHTKPFNLPADQTYLPPPPNTLTGDVVEESVGPWGQVNFDPTMATFGEVVEMAQKQGKEAAPVFEEVGKGKWVRMSDTPERLAAKGRKHQLSQAADVHARSLGPGGNEVADRLEETNAALSDQYKVEEVAKAIRSGLWPAATRGGIMASLGGGAAAITGSDYMTGALLGGLLGLNAYPANISRAGYMAGRLGEVAPTAIRTQQLTDDLLSGLDLEGLFGEEPRRPRTARRREPGR